MHLYVKVTLSLPFPDTVHHRDISTKGAAVCLISPAEMKVGDSRTARGLWTFLDLHCPDGDHCQLQVKVTLTINSNGKMISTVPIIYLLVTPNDINKHTAVTKTDKKLLDVR